VPIGRSSRISDATGRKGDGNAPIKPRRSLSGTMSVTALTAYLNQFESFPQGMEQKHRLSVVGL
jgi:hypothetical protein